MEGCYYNNKSLNLKGLQPAETFKIFTSKELAEATENYNQSRIIGRGGSNHT